MNTLGHAQPIKLTFRDSNYRMVDFTDSIPVLVDENTRLSIQQILKLSPKDDTSLFRNQILGEDYTSFFPIAVWAKIAFQNATSKEMNGYLRTCNYVDSMQLYVVKNGRLLQNRSLHAATPTLHRETPLAGNTLAISIAPHSTHTLYLCSYYNTLLESHHYREISYHSQQATFLSLIKNYSIQLFYGGAMFALMAFGFVLFILFKETKFLIFALLEISFSWYFWETKGISSAFFGYVSTQSHMFFSISLLVLSSGLLARNHAQLPKHFPLLSRWQLLLTVLLALYPHLFLSLSLSPSFLGYFFNVLIIVWALSTTLLVTLAAQRNNKEALFLARSFLVLLISAVVYILSLNQIIPSTFFSTYSLQAGSLLFSSLLFYGLYQQVSALRQKQQKALKLERLKSEFLAHIAHDFKTPLSLIMAPVQQLREHAKVPAQKEMLNLVRNNARKLEIYVNQLLDLARLENEQTHLRVQALQLHKLVEQTLSMFQSHAQAKNITLLWNHESPSVIVWGDPQMLQSILENLVGNALKFTQRGAIQVSLSENDEYTELIVKDEGDGIPEKELPHIFDRFYSGAGHTRTGSGLGLAMVYNLLEQHHATIRVQSAVGVGTTFTILFKKGRSHFATSQISNQTHFNAHLKSNIAEEVSHQQEESNRAQPRELLMARDNPLQLPHLLVVDDNAEMRRYLREALQEDYFITEALNGKEGLEQAQNYLPDLLISDMVMPKMDGLIFCEMLKKNIKTSHIPLIFLTASSSQKDRLQGLQYGADDYLTKPFDIEELRLRLANLWRNRQALKDSLQEAPEHFNSKLNPTDNIFIKRVNHIVNLHLSASDFKISILADTMKLSSSQLNRKLKSLTGYSTNQYIQHLKLTKAYQILQKQERNVSEVAHETGFSSTAYFVKCFREKFGKTPGSLRV